MALRRKELDSDNRVDREAALQRLRDRDPDHPIHALADALRPGIPRTLSPQTRHRVTVGLNGACLILLLAGPVWRNENLLTLAYAAFVLSLLLSSILPVIHPGRRRVPKHAYGLFVEEAGRTRSTAAVGPILEILPHGYAFGRAYHRDILLSALARLLPRLTVDEARALTPGQRAALRELLADRVDRTCPETVTLAALLVLGTAQDRAALPDAVAIARRPESPRLHEAAVECVLALGGRDDLDEP